MRTTLWQGNLTERDHLADLVGDGRIISKLILENGWYGRTELNQLRTGSLKAAEFVDQLNNLHFPIKTMHYRISWRQSRNASLLTVAANNIIQNNKKKNLKLTTYCRT